MSSSQFSSQNPELHLLPKCRRLLHPPEPQGQTRRSRQHLHLVVRQLTSKSLPQKSLDSEPQAALPRFLQHHRKNPFHRRLREKNVLIVIVFKWTSCGRNVRSDPVTSLQHLYRSVYYFSCVTFINIQTVKNEVLFVHFVSLLVLAVLCSLTSSRADFKMLQLIWCFGYWCSNTCPK